MQFSILVKDLDKMGLIFMLHVNCKRFSTLYISIIKKVGDFTWCNKYQRAESRVYAKSDRVVGNIEWLFSYHMTEANVPETRVFDHSPQLISFTKD